MNLTTLAQVRAWLPNLTSNTTDNLLSGLISACSSQILAYLNRPDLYKTTFTESFDGIPTSGRVMLRNWPVLGVNSVVFGTSTITKASNPGQPGWALESWDGSLPGVPQRVGISGYAPVSRGVNVGYASNGLLTSSFGISGGSGFQNLVISYVAGYVVQGEARTVPPSGGPYQLTVLAPYGNWVRDEGVTYANGTALTPVASSPSLGQYSVASGVYTFNSADASASILISYDFVPYALEQGCIEWVGERFKARDRIGMKSQSLSGQETVSYVMGMSDSTKMMISPYAKSFPL